MPVYQTLDPAIANRVLLIPGRPEYVLGTYDSKQSPLRCYITNVLANGSAATVALAAYEGNTPPVAGMTITIRGCSNALFNVNDAVITAVAGFTTGDMSTGTVTFALAQTVTTAAASGMATIPVPEVPEIIFAGASKQVGVQFNDPRVDQGRTVTAQVSMSGTLTGVGFTVTLQESDDDVSYFDCVDPNSNQTCTVLVMSGGSPVGGFVQIPSSSARWYRLNVGTITGTATASKIIGKISA
jgi:hypothetical protein